MDAPAIIILVLICIAIGALIVRAKRKSARKPPSYLPPRSGNGPSGGRGNTEER